MSTPTTEIDARFSDAGASATDWEQTQEVLEKAQLFWITTVRADGRPHVTPLVAVWYESALYFTTGDAEQKGVNLRGNQHVVLMTGRNDWDSGLDVVVEGDAARVTDQDTLRRLATAWTAKWDGSWQFEVGDGVFSHPGGGEALVFKVTPAKVLAFGKGPFSHTRYRF